MDEKEIIAVNLANYRKKAGLSQLDLAKKLQYSNKNISKWENGETIPSVFILKQIADIYGIKVDDLLSPATVETTEMVEIKSHLDKRKKNIFNFTMLLLANAIMFGLASIAIYVLGIVGVTAFNKWLLYLYITPLSALSVCIYIGVIHKMLEIISLSAFGWLTCISLYVSLIKVQSIVLIFVIGAGYQLIAFFVTIAVNLKVNNKIGRMLKRLLFKKERKKVKLAKSEDPSKNEK